MRRSGPGFSVMDQRKKRASHSSQRKGRLKIIARKMDSRIPLVFDLWVSRLRQCGHVTVIPYLPNLVTKDLFTQRKTTIGWLAVPHASVMHVLGMAIRIQPRQKSSNAAVGQCDA